MVHRFLVLTSKKIPCYGKINSFEFVDESDYTKQSEMLDSLTWKILVVDDEAPTQEIDERFEIPRRNGPWFEERRHPCFDCY